MKDYYAVLHVTDNATRSDIQAAYRQLAKQYHPDVNKSTDAHDKFCEITEAYEFLINHWPRKMETFRDDGAGQKEYVSYRSTKEYDRFRQEVRERAHQQAKMRYEKFKQQHEAFQISGINDIALLLKIAFRIAGLLLFIFLLLLPVYIAIQNGWIMIVLVFLTWPFAGIIGWYVFDNRRHYFIPGKFYYSPGRIKQLYTHVHPTVQPCFYCQAKLADSVPYKLELHKLKDLKISSGGFRQHNVNYINKNTGIEIPRSQKAFIVHSVCALIKVVSLLLCVLLVPISSIVWRFIAGMVAGGMASTLLLMVTRTRSNVSYLVSYGMICRAGLWVLFVILASHFSIKPFNINTTDSIQFVITAIIIFDCLIMQFLDFIMGKYASRPLAVQYSDVSKKIGSGYLVYNDIPVISVVYPLFKWLLG
jgi:hypothetical protein